jgi:DNA-binding transcriptional ArsR family regulator
MYDQFKQIFEKAKTDIIEMVNPWHEMFGLEKDPRVGISMDQLENEGVIKNEVFEKILYQIALVQRGVRNVWIMTGYYGVGKTSFLHFLKSVTDHFTELKGELIDYTKLTTNLKQLGTSQREDDDGDDDEKAMNPWSGESFYQHYCTLDYLLVDDCRGDGVEIIRNNFSDVKFLMFSMNLDEYEDVPSNFKHERIVLPPWSLNTIKIFLERRITTLASNKEYPAALTDIIDDDALSLLMDYTKYLPTYSLQALGILLDTLITRGERKKISKSLVESYCKSSNLNILMLILQGKIEISDAKIRVLAIIKKSRNRATPNDISTKMDVSPTNTSMHLKKLLELGLISFDKSGKNRYYELTWTGRLILEQNIMNRIG